MSAITSKKSVNDYLEELPQQVQSKLYESPAACLSIYRLLPHMAKFFIMSMVFNDNEISIRDLDRWVNSNGKLQFQDAIKSMKSLHILIPGKEQGSMFVNLNSTFRTSFRNALTGGEVNNSFGNIIDKIDDLVDSSVLLEYAKDKWETILHFMVGTPLIKMPSDNVLNLLKHSKLMEELESSGEFKITNDGFQFLLQDVNSQIWTLLLQYLKIAEALHMNPVDILNFIFMLGSLEFGKAYSVEGLSDTQKKMLKDMRDYGLIFQKTSNATVFYPTTLATQLTSDSSTVRSASGAIDSLLSQTKEANNNDSQNLGTDTDDLVGNQSVEVGALVVETNFKLYSYSNSPLQIAILSLFVHLRTRFSNMVTGQITRESIRNALANGVTADQIIAYLQSHAHPQMRRLAETTLKKKLELDPNTKDQLQILPPTVVDQIKLWQLELDRILSYDGSLYSDFDNNQEYNMLYNYAKDIGVLLWKNDRKRKFFVSKEGNSQVLDFAKRKLKKKQ
ncbi:hypothetical protein TPHA_0A01010 [Tetrapisispora phaffii CBS 4417]|uniref:RNA polymerase II transcription factor B subunit 2 n=1 Tax=Tetrapisispora phaffii (strain ATCC 24235 / CBS 4417 / NBRC 1672 / NRRL Y-8282 / UCD 70-5) TaxID=1071381 RepID=G8BMQ8_TETPH|nr:hypothetical protein TPHA_0A01010 [Tetrapisispora phaffii CBS 4417]CCE61186.1 hypothetical protein TPHA_0A01010 [Tetrapisispora phaffii CBS 4417]